MLKYCTIVLLLFSNVLVAQGPSCIPVVTFTVSQNNICTGTAITFYATVANDGTNGVFNWKKNNLNAGTDQNPDFTSADFIDGDKVTCEYSCKTACGKDTTVTSKPTIIHVISNSAPVITISNNDSIICEGELTFFTSKASYGNATPSYQWRVNGSPVGFNKPDYTTDSLTNGARVECVLTTSTPACPGTRSTSSQMTIYVYPMIHPAIKITPGKTNICRGETVTFTATANGGAAPSFIWEVNGKPTGDVSPALVTSTLKDGDSVSCTITIDQDSRCHTTTSAPSNKVGIHVQDFKDPKLQISAPALEACAGKPLTFIATTQNAGAYLFYYWQVNSTGAGSNAPTFTTDGLKNGDKVFCTLSTSIPGCAFNASVLSNVEVVAIHNAPEITFSPPEISIVEGERAQLAALVSHHTTSVLWKPEETVLTPRSLTSSTIPLFQNTIFDLTVVDTSGCTAHKEIPVKVLRKFYMPSAFTPNGDGKNDGFGIPPGSSLALQEFAVFDRWGNVVFKTTNASKMWNGTYHGRDLNAGAYVYLVKGVLQNKKVVVKGTVLLMR